MPTFMLYKDGAKVETVVGANPTNVKVRLQPFCAVVIVADRSPSAELDHTSGFSCLIYFVDFLLNKM